MRCFGDSDLSHDSFLCGRDFGRRNDEWSVGSVKSDHVIFGRVGSIEEFVELAKVFDFSVIMYLVGYIRDAVTVLISLGT